MIVLGEQLTYTVGDKTLLENVDIAVAPGAFTAIIGPNGAGKTTLLNLIDGDCKPSSGQVRFNGKALSGIDRLDLAKQRAVLPQLGNVPFAIIVRDIIALGREPYRYEALQHHDNEVIAACLAYMDIAHLADSHYNTLSGGEQHRVQVTRTLAQILPQTDTDLSGKVLFLDEPTNHLDIRHQYSLMQQLKRLQAQGLTIIAVMHDLSLTLQFAEQIVLLDQGKKIGDYTPQALVKSDALSTVYQMQMAIRWDDEWARFVVAPML